MPDDQTVDTTTESPTSPPPTHTATETAEQTSSVPKDSIDLPWSQLPGPPGGPVTALDISAANPDWIYSVSAAGGPFVSSNGGDRWIQSPEGMHHGWDINASPHDPQEARSRGERRTTNGGKTWYVNRDGQENVRAPQFEGEVADIEFDPFDEDILYAATTAGIYRTVDAGLTWSNIELDIPVSNNRLNRLATHPKQEGVLFAPLADNRIIRSTTHGESWSEFASSDIVPETPWARGIVAEASDEHTVYVPVGAGVYQFTKDGVREITAELSPLEFLNYDDISISAGDERVYFISRVHGAESWREAKLYEYDIAADEIQAIEIPDAPATRATHPSDPTTVYLGGWKWVYESTDAGESWTNLPNQFYDRYLSTIATNPTRPGTVIPGTICSGGIWVSRNHGQEYAWKRSGLAGFDGDQDRGNYSEQHYVMQSAAQGDHAYVTTAGGLLISHDNGKTWRLENDIPEDPDLPLDHYHGLAIDPVEPTVVYVGTGLGRHGSTPGRSVPPSVDEPSRIWKSVDGGQSWREITEGFPRAKKTVIQDILVSKFDTDILYVGTNADDYIAKGRGNQGGVGMGIFRSENGGKLWKSLDTPFSNVHNLDQDAEQPETLFASSQSGIYRSRDGGNQWERVLRHESHALITHPDTTGIVFAGVQTDNNYHDLLVSRDAGESWVEGSLTIQHGRGPNTREYDAMDYNADYKPSAGGWFIDLAIETEQSNLIAATRGAGLWQAELPGRFEA